MSEHKHTPGPWKAHTSSVTTADDPLELVASVFPVGTLSEDCISYKEDDDYTRKIANAYLIAAAPDLLEALERLVVQMNNLLMVSDVPERFAKSFNEGQAQARAAIAKAEGR